MGAAETWQEYKKPILVAWAASCVVWGVLQIAVLLGGDVGSASQPPGPPVTVPFDHRLHTGSDDLPLHQLARKGGIWDPEQIHLALAGPGAVFVSWATHNATIVKTKADVVQPDLKNISSEVRWGLHPDKLEHTASGNRSSYLGDYPDAIYVSGIFHHVKLEGLAPRTTYFYRCGDSSKAWSMTYNFTMPKEVGSKSFPQRVGIIGDLGQTYNSSSTLDHLEASNPEVVWLVGDYSYSDNYTPKGKKADWTKPPPVGYHNSYQPRWDSWGRLTQRTFSHRPLQGLHGNHEVELDLSNNTFQAYTNRYRYPFQESGSPSPHFYSFDIAGAHVIHLGSYVDYEEGSSQAEWLAKDLQNFSRRRTPWLIVNFHAPWYHTYIAHYKEAACHQQAVEKILYEAGVDLIFAGHVHAYSATNKVYNYSLDDCGPHHVVIGDGGNIERLYTSWVDGPGNCPNASTVACPSFQGGAFCPDKQPDWSAYREPSFGHGVLELRSPTLALWQWHRNQDGAAVVAHEMKIIRNTRCFNQQKD